MKFAKLSQPSTWGGILALLSIFGIGLGPEETQAIATAGAAVGSALATFLD